MGKLDSLKITESPYAFASFAQKHNALCDLIAGMVGQNGITVTIAEKNAIIRGNIANGSSGGAIIGNTANVVGFDGRLQNAYIGNTIANAWPAVGKYVTASGNVDISATGVVLTTTAGKTCNIAFAAITANIALQSITVCNVGRSNTMLVFGSVPV
jgi:hypothetical protein